MSGADRHDPFAPQSASPHSPTFPQRNLPTDDRDELDFLGGHDDGADVDADDRHVFDDDPIRHDEFAAPISFKRKPKPSLLASPGRLLSALTGGDGAGAGGSSSSSGGSRRTPPRTPVALPTASTSSPRRPGTSNGALHKDGAGNAAALDWHVEGPGRRVGYDDLTAIDWIFEYTKERQRLRVLTANTSGLVGYVRKLLDASQVWVVMILTGLAVGAIAALINITTDWLGDLKLGYCASGPEGGHFYLNKSFCCYGYDQGSKCTGWRSWGEALGVHALAGRWIIEYIFYSVLSIFFALCAAVLVQEYSLHAKHSGIPEIKTILGGFVIRRLLGAWTLITKSLGLILAVASGMWLGKEGPLVHVACCCANLFTKLFHNINGNEARKREVLSAAAAAGISVAFGSPIGGVLFSLEQLSYYFPDKTMWQSFVCAMTAAVSLQAFDPLRSGKLVLYQTKYSRDWHGFEIFPYAILGIVGGVYGGLFIKTNMLVARWKKANSWLPGPILQVLAVALLTALINFPNHYMKVQSTELVSNLFQECSQVLDDPVGLCTTGAASARTIVLLLFAALLGFFLAAVSFGLQIPAGIILPSMAIGALVGRAVGIVMEIWVDNHRGFFLFQTCAPDTPCITPGTYAIIGAAAALTGVTRMTVSIVVIMFELTGALTYVLPIMVAVMLSKWVGDAFSRRGIYESWIHFNEYPFLDNSEEVAVPDVPAAQIMTRIEDLVVLTATGHTIASLNEVLAAHPCRGFPVISDPRDAVLLGYISRAELSYNVHAASAPPRALPPLTEAFFAHQPLADPRTTLDLRPWMDQTPLTLPSRTNLQLVVSYFQKLGLRYVLFSDRGVLQGLLTKKDVWYVLNGADETRRTTAGGGLAGRSLAARSGPDETLLVSDEEADEDGVAGPRGPML
ncbi:chloride channel protein 3, 4 [Cordyceps javanica]|uniref:Chloride channel protein 3, 4 n=1 Tax=Cordyceps javanica TaxID=43265 RepID=A0A545VF48_9HYPO|nr:chloride channel protein 3, 4 [Cordyceps javanica]TQW11543.1 chloride channel protein 3, 4 [Cordyceps javanica]